MKKIVLFFSIISFIFAQEHILFFAGYNTHKLVLDDSATETSLKSTYSFGGEFTFDMGQNFEAGIGTEIITLSSIDGVKLQMSNRIVPAYFRIEAKGRDNEVLVPFVYATYGKLISDFSYTKGAFSVKVNDGTVTMLGAGVVLQGNIKIEVYDGTFLNEFEFTNGTTKTTKQAKNKVLGLRFGYLLR